MLIEIKKQEFDALENTALGRMCFEPIVPMIRGKDNTVKTQVYKQLTTGQQALFMFNAYYNHASNSLTEFYWWSAYYIAQPKAWSEIKNSLQYFQATSMLQLLEKTEELLQAKKHPTCLAEFDVSYKDLDQDPDLLASVRLLTSTFQEIAPATLDKIGTRIRKNPNEFIQLIE